MEASDDALTPAIHCFRAESNRSVVRVVDAGHQRIHQEASMFRVSPKIAKAVLFTALLGAATPGVARANDCTDKVIADCGAAMADAAWWEKIILGDLCSALLYGCIMK